MVAVADGDDEVGSDEHHDLAGFNDLAGQCDGLMWHVVDGLEHQEQGVVVAFDLGPLVGMHGVFHRQRMQPEQIGDGIHLHVVGFVQTDPHECLLPGCFHVMDPGEGVFGGEGPRDPLSIQIDRAVYDDLGHRGGRAFGVVVGAAAEDLQWVHWLPGAKRCHKVRPPLRRPNATRRPFRHAPKSLVAGRVP